MMSPAQASVAQLDRVLPSEGRGRGFESRRVHQIRMRKPQFERTGAFLWLSTQCFCNASNRAGRSSWGKRLCNASSFSSAALA